MCVCVLKRVRPEKASVTLTVCWVFCFVFRRFQSSQFYVPLEGLSLVSFMYRCHVFYVPLPCHLSCIMYKTFCLCRVLAHRVHIHLFDF